MSLIQNGRIYSDFYRHLSEEQINGITYFNDFGYNDDFGTTTESLNAIGGLYYWLPSTQQLQIYSDSTDDALNGTGMQKVTLEGLGGNWEPLQETVDLDGTNTVTTTNSFYRILKCYGTQAGSSETNVGQVNVDDNAQNNTITSIMPEEGKSHSATWTVAANRTSYLVSWHGSELSNKGVKMELWTRYVEDNIWFVQRLGYLIGTHFERPFTIPFSLPAKADIEIRVYGLQSGSRAAGGFSGY